MAWKSKYKGSEVEAILDAATNTVTPEDLASVALSGSYNDLTDKPSIYSKPSTGIPKSDLASTVQTSLDNAIQAPLTTTEDFGELPTIQTPINVAGGLIVTAMALFSQGTLSTSYNFDLDKSITTNGDKLVFRTDLMGEGVTHEVVFAEDLEGKQDVISDLETIRSGAAKGATALQSYTEQYKGTITGVSANGTSVATSGVANIPAATTSKYGVTKLSSATNSTSTTLAATSSAVKAAYDLANSYKGTVTSVKINGTSYSPVSGVVDLGTIESGGGSSAYPTVSTTASSISMSPNTYYKKTNVSNLTISLATPTDTSIVNEYIIEFDAFSNISLPTTLAWANNEVPTFKIGATYIISIVNNLAMVTEFQKVVNITLDGTAYQGLGGMTLAEWCNSDYNPGHYEWDGGSIVNNNKQACAMIITTNSYIYNGLSITCNEPW